MKTNAQIGSLIGLLASVITLVLILLGDAIPHGVRLAGSVVAVLIACGACGYSVAALRSEK